MITFDLELTDTFAGETNYSWVRRATITAPDGLSDLALVRRANRALDISGVRRNTQTHGDLIQLDVVGACVRGFITARY